MAYIDVTPLATAKIALRVDDTLTEDDARITMMINAAWRYIENYTNVLVYQRSKVYKLIDGCKRIYDYPINSYTTPVEADLTIEEANNYVTVSYGTETNDITVDVGHALPASVPDDLKMVAEEIIDLMYYEHETGKSYKKNLTQLSKDVLNQHKRFFL